jgi:hypothetical protein
MGMIFPAGYRDVGDSIFGSMGHSSSQFLNHRTTANACCYWLELRYLKETVQMK